MTPTQATILGTTVILGLYMAWMIGANNVVNTMADAVAARAISVRNALIVAAICEFLGALLVGSHVTETIRGRIVDPRALSERPHELALGMVCALLAASIWLTIAAWRGMPVSTTHATIGAVVGFGLAANRDAVDWGTTGQIVASWFLAPMASALAAYLLFKYIVWSILGRSRPAHAAARHAPPIIAFTVFLVSMVTLKDNAGSVPLVGRWLDGSWPAGISIALGLAGGLVTRLALHRRIAKWSELPIPQQLERVERVFAPIVVFTSGCVAYAHGANDVANAIGPVAAVIDTLQTERAGADSAGGIETWILVLGGVGIVTGLTTYGYRVMETVGSKISQLTPTRGVAADIAVATVVLVCSRLQLPISTTHTLIGAILGVGLARGLGSFDGRVAGSVFGSWLITVPASAILAGLLFAVARPLALG